MKHLRSMKSIYFLALYWASISGCSSDTGHTFYVDTPQTVSEPVRAVVEQPATGRSIVVYSQPSWCGACRHMEPVIAAAKADGANITVVSDDATARENGIHTFPTFIVYQDGKAIETHEGTQTKEQLERWGDETTVGEVIAGPDDEHK